MKMTGEEARRAILDFLSNLSTSLPQTSEAYTCLQSGSGASKRQRLNASKVAQVTHTNAVPTIGRRETPRCRRLKECKFFECDGTPGSQNIVLETSLTLIRGEKDELSICTLFASALAAHIPSLMNKLKTTLTDIGVKLKVVYLPEQADESAIEVNRNVEFDFCDAHLVMGACICLLFKHIDEKSYSKFLSARLHALAGILGMSREKIAAMRQPVTLRQAACIQGKLGADKDLKKELLLYLMELADRGGYPGAAAARYVCMILSWNEMTTFSFVFEKLCQSVSPVLKELCQTVSPVLKDPLVRHEVVKFAEAASAVARCPYPQFFRYFCTRDQEQLLSRNRFPILAAVAHRLKNAESSNPTTANFVGTLSESETTVAYLVQLHNDSMDNVHLKVVEFLTRDPSVGGFDSEDES